MADYDDQFIAGFMDDYFAECDEHLAALRELLLKLEGSVGTGRADARVLEELFLCFHSVKGISGMVELREAELLAHEMESYLRALRQREISVSQGGVDALIAGVEALEQVIKARRDHRMIPSIGGIVGRLNAAISGADSSGAAVSPSPEGGAPEWLVTFVPSMDLNARGVTVDTARGLLRARGTILHASPRILDTGIAFEFGFAGNLDAETLAAWAPDGLSASPLRSAHDTGQSGASAPGAANDVAEEGPHASLSSASHYVRVDLDKLDELMRMIADLVISRARLSDTLGRLEPRVPAADWRAVHENNATIERQLRLLREGIVRVRLVPVGEIFRRMTFVVRDLTRDSGAKVKLLLQGQGTEIDKYLIERMMDPILHLVRNAVSHAFETPPERLAAGKLEEGTLTLSAATVGDSVVIDIVDDGRGIDAEEVVRRARLAGVAIPDGPLDPATLLDLICAPGFSTRDETDRGSGRGVGMSVVKSTVQQLNGSMRLDSERGRGTRFSIELPLTLSITEALIAIVGDSTFAVPQAAIREVVEIQAEELRQLQHHEVVPYRGGTLPIVRLSRLFGLPDTPRPRMHALVVGTGLDAVGVAVDRVAGQREIVVRTTADAAIKVEGIAGATDLGDGRVVLILNMVSLARAARMGATGWSGAARHARSA